MRTKILLLLVMLMAIANLPRNALAQSPALSTSSSDQARSLQQSNTLSDPPFCDSNQNISSDWAYYDTPSGNIRIWWHTDYPNDAIKVVNLAPIADDAWEKLSTLMLRTPLSDQGSSIACRGGSDHYDVVLSNLASPGETYRYNNTSQASPSYIVLNRAVNKAKFIHNLMHAFQYSYNHAGPLSEYSWWHDATAEWAIHYIQPNLNAEHASAMLMMQDPSKELESLDAQHQYGAYLFPLFLQMQTGSSQIIRQTFEEFEHNSNSLHAINAKIPGGFQHLWHKFVLQLLNRGSLNDFEQYDNLSTQASFIQDIDVTLQNSNEQVYELNGNVKHLASHPYRFVFNDSNVRTVSFVNPQFVYHQGPGKIQMLVKINGQWQAAQDVTYTSNKTFCQDLQSERIEEMLVVISNHEWSDRQHQLSMNEKPFVVASNVACRGWDFEILREQQVTSPDHSYTEISTITGQWIRFDRDPLAPLVSPDMYYVKNIQADWQHQGSYGTCEGKSSGSQSILSSSESHLVVWTMPVGFFGQYEPGKREYQGAGTSQDRSSIQYACSDGSTLSIQLNTLWHWFSTEPYVVQSVSADGNTITGHFSSSTSDGNHHTIDTFVWTMTALPAE